MSTAHKKTKMLIETFLALKVLAVVFIRLKNVKMPTISCSVELNINRVLIACLSEI